MATVDNTTPTQEQLRHALSSIALLADSLSNAFYHWSGDEAALSYLLVNGVRQIGFISDQCQNETFQLKPANDWLMPGLFSKEEA